MNPNKTKQLAEKMGWKIHCRNTAFYVPAGHENGLCEKICADISWNPEASDTDMVELLEKLCHDKIVTAGFSKHFGGYCAYDYGIEIPKQGFPTLRAAVVSFACKCWGIEE
jgi:hypothetical protein